MEVFLMQESGVFTLSAGVDYIIPSTLHISYDLELRGPSSGQRARIRGTSHAMFQLLRKKKARLKLVRIELQHERDPLLPLRETGAAIYGLGPGHVELSDCAVFSVYGIGVWLTGKCCVNAENCIFIAGRSGYALFSHSQATLRGCAVTDCGVHGVCARGGARVFLNNCTFKGNNRRAVYGYENAQVEMCKCDISLTKDERRSAVEIGACKADNHASLRLLNCRFRQNQGANIRIRGAGQYFVHDTMADQKPCLVDVTEAEYGQAVELKTIEAPFIKIGKVLLLRVCSFLPKKELLFLSNIFRIHRIALLSSEGSSQT